MNIVSHIPLVLSLLLYGLLGLIVILGIGSLFVKAEKHVPKEIGEDNTQAEEIYEPDPSPVKRAGFWESLIAQSEAMRYCPRCSCKHCRQRYWDDIWDDYYARERLFGNR